MFFKVVLYITKQFFDGVIIRAKVVERIVGPLH